jgi:hypothetical protein
MASVSEGRRVLDNAMSEKEFQSLVIELAKRTGWLCHHQTIPYRVGRDGKPRAIVEPNTDRGFNDLVLVHQARGLTVFPELKRIGGRLSADQQRWGDALLACGLDWRVWFPSDWDEIVALLKGE